MSDKITVTFTREEWMSALSVVTNGCYPTWHFKHVTRLLQLLNDAEKDARMPADAHTEDTDKRNPVDELLSQVCACTGKLDVVGGNADGFVLLCQRVRRELQEAVASYRRATGSVTALDNEGGETK